MRFRRTAAVGLGSVGIGWVGLGLEEPIVSCFRSGGVIVGACQWRRFVGATLLKRRDDIRRYEKPADKKINFFRKKL